MLLAYEHSKKVHNCTNEQGHTFEIVKSLKEKQEFSQVYPGKPFPLWKCRYCGKYKTSM